MKTILAILFLASNAFATEMIMDNGLMKARADGLYVNTAGDTMTGQLVMPAAGILWADGTTSTSNTQGIAQFSSLTPGTLPVATAANAIGDSLVYQNAGGIGLAGSVTAGSMTVVGNSFVDGYSYVGPYSGIYDNANYLKVGAYNGISFVTSEADLGSQTERMAINNAGDVGVNGANFSVGGSTLVVAGGNVGIGTVTPGTALEIGTTGKISMGVDTKANILAYDPVRAGEMIYCSNCVASTICISTGTAVADFADIGDRTVACN
jgi:hypothetical protein